MARGWPDNWDPRKAYTPPYQKLVSTPKATLEAAPQSTTWTLEKGILTRLVVIFPAGSARLLCVQIFEGETQIAPKESGYYFGNNTIFILDHWNYALITDPYQLTVKTWNTSTKYAHAVDLHIDVSKYD